MNLADPRPGMGYTDPVLPSEHVNIGESSQWFYGPIAADVEVGARTVIHPSAVILSGTRIGADCVIGPNVTIGNVGFGYEKQRVCADCPNDTTCPPCYGKPEWEFREHPFGVVIGDRVAIGAGTTIDRGRYRDTIIRDGTKIDANVFIAHNCLLGERCLVIANSQISGSCVIGDDCHIGPAAMLTDHITVGNRGRCGLGAVVIRNVPAGVTVVGNPARDIQERRNATLAKGMGDGSDDITLVAEGPTRLGECDSCPQDTTCPPCYKKRYHADGSESWLADERPLSLPYVPWPGESELEQRQRAARQGWLRSDHFA